MPKELDVVSVLQNNQTEGLKSRLRSLIAFQRRNLQNLSALVVFNFLAAGLFFLTQVKIANVIGKELEYRDGSAVTLQAPGAQENICALWQFFCPHFSVRSEQQS